MVNMMIIALSNQVKSSYVHSFRACTGQTVTVKTYTRKP